MKKPKYQPFLIKTDGTREEVVPKNGKYFELKEMQELVGGYIQFLQLNDDNILVINEEGKLEGLPFNKDATLTAMLDEAIGILDYIVGDALLCHKSLIR